MFSYWNPGPSNRYEKPLQTHVTEEMYESIKKYSDKYGISMGEYVRRAIAFELGREMERENSNEL